MRQTLLSTLMLSALLLTACAPGIPESSPTPTVRPKPTDTATPRPSPTASPASPEPTATASPTSSPTPTDTPPIPSATASPVPAESIAIPVRQVRVYETTLTLATYGYQTALQATEPDDMVYPYPRLVPELVTPAEPREYTAIVLENDYVALTLLPELGGRVYRWVDKATGRHLLYENPVIKPTSWGYRGWWLAAGGIEFAFPVEEHGLNEWRPWRYDISQSGSTASVTVSDVEDRTGLTAGVTISLDAYRDSVLFRPWVKNDTESAQAFQYWLNAMVTLGDNHVSGQTRLVFPTTQVVVHSTGDESLPDAWQPMSWPMYEGRDLSHYETWGAYLGFFVPQVDEGFVALYDEEADQGLVRAFAPGWPAGTKFFGPGTLPSWLWTDDDSTYVELWSGITPTFADMTTLAPGDTVEWVERWYPVHGMGSITSATAEGAVALKSTETGVEIGCAVTAATAGTLTLWADGEAFKIQDIELAPNEAYHDTWHRPENSGSALGVTLQDENGRVLVKAGNVP